MNKIYAVRDLKSETFGPLFIHQNDSVAKRAVTAAAADGNSLLGQYPMDFELFCLGTYDEETGRIDSDGLVQFVSSVSALVGGK